MMNTNVSYKSYFVRTKKILFILIIINQSKIKGYHLCERKKQKTRENWQLERKTFYMCTHLHI